LFSVAKLCFRRANPSQLNLRRNWNDHCIDIFHLLDNLNSHRSLAGDDRGIVVAIDISETFVGGELVRVRFGFGEIVTVQNNVGAKLLAIRNFDQWRVFAA